MEVTSRESAAVDVGYRLRVLREERGVSMRSLARRSGLSANALSMIERGLTSPSVSTLSKLANALEVPIMAFFRKEPDRQSVVYCKANDRNRIDFTNGFWEGLGSEYFNGRLEAFLLTLDDGGASGPHGMIHTGYEFIFCLEGKVEYEVDGQIYQLEKGDSLIFAANMLHRWHNMSKKPSKLIMLISGFEDSERPLEYHIASASQSASGNGSGEEPLDDDEGDPNV
ncbi:MAG TPA: cupin domain-containing protein [Anaerolineaceae bacterium]